MKKNLTKLIISIDNFKLSMHVPKFLNQDFKLPYSTTTNQVDYKNDLKNTMLKHNKCTALHLCLLYSVNCYEKFNVKE